MGLRAPGRSRILRSCTRATEALVLTSWFTARSGLPAPLPASLGADDPRSALAALTRVLKPQALDMSLGGALGRSLDDLPAGSVSSEFTVGADTSGTSSGQQQNEMMAAMCEGVGEASLRLEELEELALVLDGGRDARRPPPRTIECYDVSHLYGSYTVAAASAATCGVLDLDRYGCYPLGPDSGVPPADDCAALRAALRLRFGGSGGIGGVAAAGTAVRVDGGVRAAKGVGAEMGVGTEAIVGAAATRVGAEGRVEAAAGVGAEGGLEAATAGSGVSWDAWDVPDLILIDGGKPQLGAAMAVLDELDLSPRPQLLALAKQQEELYLPFASSPLRLPMSSPALTLCRRLRDEAHASALLSHRILRHSNPFASVLDGAPGLSLTAKARLRAAFGGSAVKLRQATEDDLFEALQHGSFVEDRKGRDDAAALADQAATEDYMFTALREGRFTAAEAEATGFTGFQDGAGRWDGARDGASIEDAFGGGEAIEKGAAAQGRGRGGVSQEGSGEVLFGARGHVSVTGGLGDTARGGRANTKGRVKLIDPTRTLASQLADHLRRSPPPPPRLNLTLTLDGYDSAAAAVGGAAGRRAGVKVSAQAAEASAGRWWRQRRAQRMSWLEEHPEAPVQMLGAVAAVVHSEQAVVHSEQAVVHSEQSVVHSEQREQTGGGDPAMAQPVTSRGALSSPSRVRAAQALATATRERSDRALAGGGSSTVFSSPPQQRAGAEGATHRYQPAAEQPPRRYQALDPAQPLYEALARLEAALGAWGPPGAQLAPGDPDASELDPSEGDDAPWPFRFRRAIPFRDADASPPADDGVPPLRYDARQSPLHLDEIATTTALPTRRIPSLASSGLAFQLEAPYAPSGDQPAAIAGLVSALRAGAPRLQLKGATGTGKTFVMASVVAQMNLPTLVLAPNKVLAAQLCGELRAFFPNNAVTYFVSHFDHYRPEAYKPTTDVFVEKSSRTNAKVESLRHEATRCLFERRDTIVVATVSCIYGLGLPEEYLEGATLFAAGQGWTRGQLDARLRAMLYTEGRDASPAGLERGEYGWFQFNSSRGRVERHPKPGVSSEGPPPGAAATPFPEVLAIQLVHESRRLEILFEPSGGGEAPADDGEDGIGDAVDVDRPLEVSALRLIEWGDVSTIPANVAAAGSMGMDVGDGSGTGREARAGGGAIRGSEERARQGIAQGRKEREGTPSRAQMGRLGAPSLVPPAPPLSAELLASLSEAGRRFVTCIGAPGRSLHGGGAEGGADASGDADAGDGASVGGGVGDATGAGAAERKKAGASGKNGAGSAVESAVSAEAGVGVGAGTSAGEDAAGRKRSVASVKASAGVQAGVGGAGDSSPSGEAADVGVGLSEIVVYPASHHVSTEKERQRIRNAIRAELATHASPAPGPDPAAASAPTLWSATPACPHSRFQERQRILSAIRCELATHASDLRARGDWRRAEALELRVASDLAEIEEKGFCRGLENYSRHLANRAAGEAPATLLDYLPQDDWMLLVDESHVTVPQLAAMHAGDRARKLSLVEHGFRLPSALDNRPLREEEFWERVPRAVLVSATPGNEARRLGAVGPAVDTAAANAVRDPAFPASVLPTAAAVDAGAYAGGTGLPAGVNGGGVNGGGGLVELVVRPTGVPDPLVEVVDASRLGGYEDHLLSAIEERRSRSERVLVTVLTRRAAEELSAFFTARGVKSAFIHSEVKQAERLEAIDGLRAGTTDVLVGCNLLREGIDLPEVSLVAIVSADKQGFLRSETSLVQTIGRAARHVRGTALLYTDAPGLTPAMHGAIRETKRRRRIQLEHNERHGIVPQGAGARTDGIGLGLVRRPANPILAMLQTDSKLKLKAAVDSLTEDELRTYAALRSWRDATAEMAGLPPFRVMYEAVAVAVVKAAPADAKALRAVRGVGPKFEELYGPSVLECLAAERALRARGVGGEQELELEGRSSGGERVAAVQLGSGG